MDEAFQDIFSNDFEDSSSEYGDSSSKEEISGVYSDLDQLTQGMFLNLFAIFKYFGIDTVYCTIADWTFISVLHEPFLSKNSG